MPAPCSGTGRNSDRHPVANEASANGRDAWATSCPPYENQSAHTYLWERCHRDGRVAVQQSRWHRSHSGYRPQAASCYKRTSRNPRKETPVQLPSFKMSDKSLFAVLLRSPWWISFALAVVVGAACFKLFPDRFAIVGALSGLPFAVIGGIALWKQRGIPNAARIDATLQKLAALSARDFASTLEAAYAKDGYVVTKVTASGADLSITKAGRTALINSKRWKAATHGIDPVRELGAAMEALDANQGVYIAVNALSDAARTFASKNSIRVMQGTELALLMKSATPQK